MAEKQMMKVTSEADARRLWSGFVPPRIKAQLDANRDPTPAEIEAAKALLAKVKAKQ